MSGVEYIAATEDGVMWFGRSCSRREARAEVASLTLERAWWWRWLVKPEHMRPATRDDCDAKVHRDEDEDSEDCRCWDFAEGWHFVCAADHPDAIPVWRVEARSAPSWWWKTRRRLRALHGSNRRRYDAMPLWGHRVERRVRWFDRLLLGRGPALVLGDGVWRLGQGEVRYCDVCRQQTLHVIPSGNGAPWCRANDHHEHAAAVRR